MLNEISSANTASIHGTLHPLTVKQDKSILHHVVSVHIYLSMYIMNYFCNNAGTKVCSYIGTQAVVLYL